jgi:S-adenosylmethionine decarboxylase
MEIHNHFGEHMTIDGYGGNKVLLNDKDLVLNILAELPTLLGMHILKAPEVVFAPAISPKDQGGWSGFVIISESHISIHTFPQRQFISIDVYTCQNDLDKPKIENYFKEKFELKELETNFIIRGKKYFK